MAGWIGDDAVDLIEAEREDFSFEDSEQFEDDSLCSVVTNDSISGAQTWRGWEVAGNPSPVQPPAAVNVESPRVRSSSRHGRPQLPAPAASRSSGSAKAAKKGGLEQLSLLAARACARFHSFSALEATYRAVQQTRPTPCIEGTDIPIASSSCDTIPDKLFLAIIFWCFPESEEELRLYSCLANGGIDEFNRGEAIYNAENVRNAMQIGYHLSAVVTSQPTREEDADRYTRVTVPTRAHNNVSIRVDRCRVVACKCSCGVRSWCSHVIALCLYRLHRPHKVEFRVTIWDSVNELGTAQLKKFAQYLINELPKQFLPLAQKLLDELKQPNSAINLSEGAPDPTDSGHDMVALWSIDQTQLHERICKTLFKFCQPAPTVHCDVQYLSSTQPPIAAEWQVLLRPLRSRGPEGLWNLLSIVRAMFQRRDENATMLLHVITDECLASTQVLLWWYVTSLTNSGRWTQSHERKTNPLLNNMMHTQLCSSQLCDEMVSLWRVAALNPILSSEERKQLAAFIQLYHRAAVDRIWTVLANAVDIKADPGDQHHNIISLLISTTINEGRQPLSTETARFSHDQFAGFYPALQACNLNITDMAIPCNEYMMHDGPSPHIPQMAKGGLRKPYTVSSICPAYYYPGMAPAMGMAHCTKKHKKKKKSHKHRSSRTTGGSSSSRHHSNRNNSDVQHSRRHVRVEPEVEEDSTESGQESDIAGPSRPRKERGERTQAPPTGQLSEEPFPPWPSFIHEDVNLLFAAAHAPLDGLELKFTRCEALHGHGYSVQSVRRAGELVNAMRANLPRLLLPFRDPKKHQHEERRTGLLPAGTVLRRTITSTGDGIHTTDDVSVFPCQTSSSHYAVPDHRLHAVSELACKTMERAIFLGQVLLSHRSYHASLFRFIFDILHLPRGAMSTKSLQVKMFHLESQLLSVFEKLDVGTEELEMIRERVSAMEGQLATRPQPARFVPPVLLATYAFDMLVERRPQSAQPSRAQSDEDLAMSLSLAVIGAKHTFSESEFPMLAECLRRQRGDLALKLLVRYNNSNEKIGLILDKLLDPTVHQMYKHHKSNAAYFLDRDPMYQKHFPRGERPVFPYEKALEITEQQQRVVEEDGAHSSLHHSSSGEQSSIGSSAERSVEDEEAEVDEGLAGRVSEINLEECSSSSISTRRSSDEGNEESSSNSAIAIAESSKMEQVAVSSLSSTSHYSDGPGRYKMRRTSCSSEAHAHYMMELAKRILVAAGGDQSSVIFAATANGPQGHPNVHGPHRKLHMCSFLTGLYALGLANEASRNWASRTYSTHVSWVHGQVMDIGTPAMEVIRATWPAHLTPPEAAALADKGSQSRDPSTVEESAQLALSVLGYSHALSVTEGHRALIQCRDQNVDILHKALTAVEEASKKGEVYPEILFMAAKIWADLSLDSDPPPSQTVSGYPPVMNPAAGGPNTAQNPAMYGQRPPIPQPPMAYQQRHPMQYQQSYMGYPTMPPSSQSGYSMPPMQMQSGYPYMPPTSQQQVPSGPPPPQYQHVPPPGSAGQFSSPVKAEEDRDAGPSSSRAPMHSSHSAPNLVPTRKGSSDGYSMLPPMLSGGHLPPGVLPSSSSPMVPPTTSRPPPPLPLTTYDPRLERLCRAQHIGLRAMETMGSRNNEDRGFGKFSSTPQFEEEILWLFMISQRLGGVAVMSFCDMAARTIASPYLLWQLANETLRMFPGSFTPIQPPPRLQNLAQIKFAPGLQKVRQSMLSSGYHQTTADLCDRCIEMLYLAISQKMSHPRFCLAESEDVLNLIRLGKEVFQLCPAGRGYFDELVWHTRKQKGCKKDIVQKIIAVHQHCQSTWGARDYNPQ